MNTPVPSEVLRVGVIGCGDIARKSYLPQMHDPACNIFVVALCDIIVERAEAARQEFVPADADCKVYADYEQMLQTGGLDLVVVLTPVATHPPFVRASLNAGVHVYSEKPLALTRTEAESLCELAESKNLHLMAAPLLMVYPEYQWLRETVRAGAVGKPTFVRAHSSHGGANRGMWATDSGNFFREDTAGPMPPLFDMGVYALTILTNCLGSVKSVSALAGIGVAERRIEHVAIPDFVPYTLHPTVPDNLALMLDFGDACFATIDASFCFPYKKGPSYEFYGWEGALYHHGGDDGIELISEKPAFAAPDADKPVSWHAHPLPSDRRADEKLKWGQALTRHFAECRQSGARPLMPARHALHVVEIMERAKDAARTGRTQTLETSASPTRL